MNLLLPTAPAHGRVVIRALLDVTKVLRTRADGRLARHVVEDAGHLPAGDVVVGPEQAVFGARIAVDQVELGGCVHDVEIPCAGGHVPEDDLEVDAFGPRIFARALDDARSRTQLGVVRIGNRVVGAPAQDEPPQLDRGSRFAPTRDELLRWYRVDGQVGDVAI